MFLAVAAFQTTKGSPTGPFASQGASTFLGKLRGFHRLGACTVAPVVIVFVYTLNPLEDPRWTSFVETHLQSSVFHTSSYLDALRRTYGYGPIVYTTSVPGQPLANGIVLCRVSSWLTGSRLVSVPFADHCEPLVASARDRAAIVAAIQTTVRDGNLKYAQIRAIHPDLAQAAGSGDPRTFAFHTLDLTPPIDRLYSALHKTAIQQPVRRAEREGVVINRDAPRRCSNSFTRCWSRRDAATGCRRNRCRGSAISPVASAID